MLKAEILQNNVIIISDNTVSDSVKFETVYFKFPKSWEGFNKTAVFTSSEGEVYNVVLAKGNSLCVSEAECYIPHEVLNCPGFEISVFGVSGESVATATKAYVKVLQSGLAEGEEPQEPTPSEYQQILSLVNNAQEIAQSVRDDADNGVFDGQKGEKGEFAEIDPALSPDSTNPVQNKVLFDLLTLTNTVGAVATKSSLTIDNAVPAIHPIDIKITQVVFDKVIGNNKSSISECAFIDDFGEVTYYPGNAITFSGDNAIFSFNATGTVPTMVSFYSFEKMESTNFEGTPIVCERQIQTDTETGRKYFVIGDTEGFSIDRFIFDDAGRDTVLTEIALRIDGSHEYEEYTEIKHIIDPSTITITERNSGQTANANADGNIADFVSTADGNMTFVKSGENISKFYLSVTYKRSLSSVVEELKA